MVPRSRGIRVYGSAVMPYTEKVVRALRLKGVAHTLVEPASRGLPALDPDTGLLPVREIDSRRVPESAAILDLLDACFPEPPLLAADPRLARDQRGLETGMGETFSFYLFRWLRARLGSEPVPGDEGGPQGPMARLLEHTARVDEATGPIMGA